MPRKKKRQTSFFTESKQTPVPIFADNKRRHSSTEQQQFVKRTKTHHNNDPVHMLYFNDSIRNYISTVILAKIKKSKKLDADLLKMKEDLSQKQRLPAGIMTNAATFAELEPHVMKNFIDNNAPKLPVDLFTDFVKENFDSIAKYLKEKNLTFQTPLFNNGSECFFFCCQANSRKPTSQRRV